ncbi:MAG: hypothetical protein LAO05_12470 [Acidobacteriia bacterium]|nr:hypothetical protein [Terriglobia bacterium]
MMRAHPFAAERDRPATERGSYLVPLERCQPAETAEQPDRRVATVERAVTQNHQAGRDESRGKGPADPTGNTGQTAA